MNRYAKRLKGMMRRHKEGLPLFQSLAVPVGAIELSYPDSAPPNLPRVLVVPRGGRGGAEGRARRRPGGGRRGSGRGVLRRAGGQRRGAHHHPAHQPWDSALAGGLLLPLWAAWSTGTGPRQPALWQVAAGAPANAAPGETRAREVGVGQAVPAQPDRLKAPGEGLAAPAPPSRPPLGYKRPPCDGPPPKGPEQEIGPRLLLRESRRAGGTCPDRTYQYQGGCYIPMGQSTAGPFSQRETPAKAPPNPKR